jgi:hypothetical protein
MTEKQGIIMICVAVGSFILFSFGPGRSGALRSIKSLMIWLVCVVVFLVLLKILGI